MPSANSWIDTELETGKAAALALVEHLLRMNLLSAEIAVSVQDEQFIVRVLRKPLPPCEKSSPENPTQEGS
jgi:hypothetical protein